MADLVLKMFQFLIEKFAFASKYIVAAFVGAVLLVAIFGYFFGRQMLEPRIDYYLMTKINAYFEGEAGLLASAKQVDPKIKNVATEKLKTITESLYDEVDAVYPISNSVTRADLEKLGTKSSLNVPLYVYADLKKHRVLIFLNRRQLSFDYKICFNGTKLGPRILEDPSRYLIQQFSNDNPPAETYYRKIDGKVDQQPVYPGIPDVPSSYVKYLRAAFAIDEPGRQSDQNKDRDVARNGYILVTTTPAGYWDLQDLFKSAEFYANEMYAPRWAVNLPGDDYAALIYSDPSKNSGSNAIEVGDVALRQASALAIVARK